MEITESGFLPHQDPVNTAVDRSIKAVLMKLSIIAHKNRI
jgi:hypothetical protein